MNNQLMNFENVELGKVRVLERDGEPWFVAKDVAEILGYAKPRNAIATHVDEDDKKDAPIQGDLGGTQNMVIINESGLYSLILKSKLDSAKKFKRWVTKDVLPSLRQHGTYSIQTNKVNDNVANLVQSTMTAILPVITEQMAKVVIETKEAVNNMAGLLHDQSEIYDADRENLKDLIGFRSVNTTRMCNTVKEKLNEKLGKRIRANDREYLKVKKEIFKEFEVIKWEDIPVEKYNSVFAFVDTYIDEEM